MKNLENGERIGRFGQRRIEPIYLELTNYAQEQPVVQRIQRNLDREIASFVRFVDYTNRRITPVERLLPETSAFFAAQRQSKIDEAFWNFRDRVVYASLPNKLSTDVGDDVMRRYIGAYAAEAVTQRLSDARDTKVNQELSFAVRRVLMDCAEETNLQGKPLAKVTDMAWVNKLTYDIIFNPSAAVRQQKLNEYINDLPVLGSRPDFYKK